MRKGLAFALVAYAALSLTACDRTDDRAVGRLNVTGKAEVVAVDGSLKEVTRSRTLRTGEQVTVVDGTAVLSLGGGRSLELRKGTVVRLALETGPLGTSVPRGELVAGDLLVQAPEEAATVVAADTTVQVTAGVARVSRNLAVVVGVYRGSAGVESAGRAESVSVFRQRTVPAPGLPSRATPLTFSATDPWDQRFLGEAIDLSDRLVATSRGFTNPPGYPSGSSVSLFTDILPQLSEQSGFDGSLIDPARAPGETLVGAAIALEGAKGSFPERWASVFAFHDDGAPWGLVAMDQAVSPGPLLATIDGAIRRLSGQRNELAAPTTATSSAQPSTAPVSVPVPSLPTPSDSAPSAGGSTLASASTPTTIVPGGTGAAGSSSAPPAGGGSTTTNRDPYERVTGPSNLGLPLVDETVNSVVDALSGLLRAIGR
jgi:hypothetical protein